MTDFDLLDNISKTTHAALLRAYRHGVFTEDEYIQRSKQLTVALRISRNHIKRGIFNRDEAIRICAEWEKAVDETIRKRPLH